PAVPSESIDQRRHRLRTGRRRQDYAGASQLLQLRRGIRRSAVNVDARTQLLRERRILRPAPNGGDLVATLLRELDAQMAEPANPLDGHEVTRLRAAVAQRIEGRNPRTEQR